MDIIGVMSPGFSLDKFLGHEGHSRIHIKVAGAPGITDFKCSWGIGADRRPDMKSFRTKAQTQNFSMRSQALSSPAFASYYHSGRLRLCRLCLGNVTVGSCPAHRKILSARPPSSSSTDTRFPVFSFPPGPKTCTKSNPANSRPENKILDQEYERIDDNEISSLSP